MPRLTIASVTNNFTDKLNAKEREITSLRQQLEVAEARLTEARRRTIPYNGGEVNFFPLAIERLDFKYDTVSYESWSGLREVAQGMARATIICTGAIVMTPEKPVTTKV
jgi:hypothetical protein